MEFKMVETQKFHTKTVKLFFVFMVTNQTNFEHEYLTLIRHLLMNYELTGSGLIKTSRLIL